MRKKNQSNINLSIALIVFGLFSVSGLKAQHRMDARMDSTGTEIFTPYNRPNTPVQSNTQSVATTEQVPDTFLVHPMTPWVKANKAAKLKAASETQPQTGTVTPEKTESVPSSEDKQVNSPK